MTGPFPSRGLVRPGQQLDRVSQVTVPGDRTVVIPVETDDLGQKMRISGVALGAGSRMPLSIPRRGQRVDREHLIASSPQRRDPWTTVGLDSDHHLAGSLVVGLLRPG